MKQQAVALRNSPLKKDNLAVLIQCYIKPPKCGHSLYVSRMISITVGIENKKATDTIGNGRHHRRLAGQHISCQGLSLLVPTRHPQMSFLGRFQTHLYVFHDLRLSFAACFPSQPLLFLSPHLLILTTKIAGSSSPRVACTPDVGAGYRSRGVSRKVPRPL